MKSRAGQKLWVSVAGASVLALLMLGYVDARRRSARAVELYAEAVWQWQTGPAVASVPASHAARAPRLPRARELRQPTTPLRLGLYDMLRLQGCEVSRLIGERNSQLGRVRGDDYQLAYAVAFIGWAPRCDVAEPELAVQLQQAVAVHRRELGQRVFNAIWAAPELRALFEPSSLPSWAAEPWAGGAQVASEGLRALSAVAREPLQRVDQLGPALEALHRGRASAQLWPLGERARVALRSATHALQTSEVCPNESEAQAAFERHYIGAAQPRLVRLHRALRGLSGALSELLAVSLKRLGRPLPEQLERHAALWYSGPGSLEARLKAASLAHAGAWQNLQARCQFRWWARPAKD